MLQSLRDNLKGTFAFIIIGIIVVPLALFGVESLFNDSGATTQAAKVNGEDISEDSLRRAVFMQKQQMLARFGQNLPAEFISDERLREPALRNLIDRKLLTQAASSQGMAVSNAKLDEIILTTPEFQIEGKFNPEQFTNLIRNIGYTPTTYKVLLEADVVANQLQLGMSGSGFVLPSELQATAALTRQTRDFSFVTLSKSKALAAVEVTPEEVEAYYADNKTQFVQAEQVAVEYIDLTPDALVAGIELSDEEIQARYDDNISKFEANVERRVAHILLEVQDDASELAKLAEIKAKLASGEDFFELAKAYSEDVGTNQSGGDLGFNSAGTFPEEFETALLELETDQVSDAVETDAGIHIIKLLEVRGEDAPTFADQKSAIIYALKNEKADAAFADLVERLAEQSYNAESLKTVAADLGVVVAKTELFGRDGGTGLTADSNVLAAVFSDDVLLQGNASEVLELGDRRAVVVKLVDRVESHIKELSLVTAEIESKIKADKATALMMSQGESLLAAASEGESLKELAEAGGLVWAQNADVLRSDSSVPRDLIMQAFSLPKPSTDPVLSGFNLSNGDFVVLSLSNVNNGAVETLTSDELASLSSQMTAQAASSDVNAYRRQLEQAAAIEIR